MGAETRQVLPDALVGLMGLLHGALQQEGVITLLLGCTPSQRGSHHANVLHLPEADGIELAEHLAQRLLCLLRGHTCPGSEETAARLAEELLYGELVPTRPPLRLVSSTAGTSS